MSKFAYHGTPHIEKVLREGIDGKYSSCECNCIWLARRPEDATASGDVIEIDMTGIPGGIPDDEWQGTYPNGYLGPKRLRVYRSLLALGRSPAKGSEALQRRFFPGGKP